MSEEMLIRHCAPTLAGLKTGNMFNAAFESEAHLRESVCALNRRFRRKGLHVVPLRYRNGRALLYVYRPGKLAKDLLHKTAADILTAGGYQPEKPRLRPGKHIFAVIEAGDRGVFQAPPRVRGEHGCADRHVQQRAVKIRRNKGEHLAGDLVVVGPAPEEPDIEPRKKAALRQNVVVNIFEALYAFCILSAKTNPSFPYAARMRAISSKSAFRKPRDVSHAVISAQIPSTLV